MLKFLRGQESSHQHEGRKPRQSQDVAEDWYLQLRGKLLTGELKAEKTFREVSEQFLRECEIMTRGERSTQYVKGQHLRSSVHLVPFFGNMDISKITTGKIVDYRVHRHQQAIAKRGKPPAHSTMHHEIVTLRQTLKTALCHGWLDRLPDFSEPYRRSSKVSYRAWFSPEEYEKLCEATRKRAREPKKERFKWQAEQLHDYVLFAGNTGLRPDEARRLEFRDVEIVDDEPSGETILEIEVRGKRGFGYCKSLPDAVSPFERLRSRLRPRRDDGVRVPTEESHSSEWRTPEATDLIFPKWQSELFKIITEEENLRFDRDGRPRTAYSLRHTYISMRLMEGANIYQIAKNCRTSVGMIEKYYGVHVKNSLNAAAINVVRSGKDVMAEQFEYLTDEE